MSVSDEVLDQARMQQMEQREQEVDSMIRSNRYASAVQTALSNPPLGTKNQDIKVRKNQPHNTHKPSAFAGESFGWPGTTLFVDVKKNQRCSFLYFNNNCWMLASQFSNSSPSCIVLFCLSTFIIVVLLVYPDKEFSHRGQGIERSSRKGRRD